MILIKLVIQVMMVIFRNLLILVNLVISGISSDYCESDASGAYGHSCDSGDYIESAHSCEYDASDKNGYSVDSGKSGDFEKTIMCGKSGNSCQSSDNGDFGDSCKF